MDVETSGKPNQLVSIFGIQDELPLMASLSEMSSEEFVETAEYLVDDQHGKAGKKILEKVMKDRFDNEYNRTKVLDRRALSQTMGTGD